MSKNLEQKAKRLSYLLDKVSEESRDLDLLLIVFVKKPPEVTFSVKLDKDGHLLVEVHQWLRSRFHRKRKDAMLIYWQSKVLVATLKIFEKGDLQSYIIEHYQEYELIETFDTFGLIRELSDRLKESQETEVEKAAISRIIGGG